MELICQLDEVPDAFRRGAVAIGNFDGVHQGHARIVKELIASARQVEGPAVIFTFDPHPVRVLRPELAPPPLTWTDRKAALLAELGVDAMVAYPTDRRLLQLRPEDFFQLVVLDKLAARAVVEGPNFCFGRDRKGTVATLERLCRAADVQLQVVEPLKINDRYVSSSRVRELIQQGDVQQACQLLTRPYRVRGLVTHGVGRGASIGFPTANVEGIDTLIPAQGVYAGRAMTSNRSWPAAVHIGPNPTFGEKVLKVEVHLIGYEGSLYGQTVEVDFLARLRDIQPFGSAKELRDQIEQDVRRATAIAGAQ